MKRRKALCQSHHQVYLDYVALQTYGPAFFEQKPSVFLCMASTPSLLAARFKSLPADDLCFVGIHVRALYGPQRRPPDGGSLQQEEEEKEGNDLWRC